MLRDIERVCLYLRERKHLLVKCQKNNDSRRPNGVGPGGAASPSSLLPRLQSLRQPQKGLSQMLAGLEQQEARDNDLAFPRHGISGRACSEETSNLHSGWSLRTLPTPLPSGLLRAFWRPFSATAPPEEQVFPSPTQQARGCPPSLKHLAALLGRGFELPPVFLRLSGVDVSLQARSASGGCCTVVGTSPFGAAASLGCSLLSSCSHSTRADSPPTIAMLRLPQR